MQTLELTYTSHKGAKAIYLENNLGDHLIVCPLQLSSLLRNSGKDATLNLCQLSFEGNLIDDTVLDVHSEGAMVVLNIRKNNEFLSSQYILTRQQFMSMAQKALQALALTKMGTRRNENAFSMAI